MRGAAVHLVFGDSLAGSLKLAIDQMGYKDTHKVVTFRDRFAIGPLWRLQEEAGRAERARWFRDHINEDREEMDYEYVAEADDRRLAGQLARIPAGASIILWTGDNAHEQAGLRYAAYLLRHSRNEMFVIDAGKACAARFNTADRTIEYMHSGEVSPEKLKAILGKTGRADRSRTKRKHPWSVNGCRWRSSMKCCGSGTENGFGTWMSVILIRMYWIR
ncbi:DUF1835 domain-containing protein [Paenibacillus sp. P26]|nr:DUF1835 domain-containing protein [Paenibacillus sp. P26]